MKPTFTHIFLLLLFCAASIAAKAQSGKQTSISIGPDAGIPFNTEHAYGMHTRDVYQDGLGGNIRIEFPITANLHATASIGYAVYHSNLKYLYLTPYQGTTNTSTLPSGPPPYKYIPLKAGLRYYYAKYLYVAAEAGEAVKVQHGAMSSFIYSGGAGAVIPFGTHHGVDIGLRYEGGYKSIDADFKMSQLGIGVAYKYSF